jgi:Cysteine-rich secretory protein family
MPMLPNSTLRLGMGALLGALLATAGQSAPGDPGSEEAELARLVNDYRRANGLPPVPRSRSLTLVAQLHARDLALNQPATGQDSRGLPCNLHSWSAAGHWRPVCYTADHRYKELMWSKPREITRGAYPGNGYEISAAASYKMTAPQALGQWQRSAAHHSVILQKGIWTTPWRAMGVGIYEGYAVIWFGKEPDPAP